MMKLYNSSHYDGKLLRDLLRRAARLVKVRVFGVPVKVTNTRGRENSWRGAACRCARVRRYYLVGSHKGEKPMDWVECDGGYVELVLPRLDRARFGEAADELAMRVFRLMLHEWSHVAEYQEDPSRSLPSSNNGDKRRPKWSERPEEIRANDREEEAAERMTVKDKEAVARLAQALRGGAVEHKLGGVTYIIEDRRKAAKSSKEGAK